MPRYRDPDETIGKLARDNYRMTFELQGVSEMDWFRDKRLVLKRVDEPRREKTDEGVSEVPAPAQD